MIMEEEKVMKEEAKKEKEKRDMMNFGPHIKASTELLSQFSQTKLTQSTQKKKKNSFLFHS